MHPAGIGAPIRRVEDPALLRGQGRYVADIEIPGALHCVLVRSPHAHARILSLDPAAALRRPGTVAVLTGADMVKAQIGPMRPLWAIRSADGSPMAEPPRYALARDVVRHVGEPIAAIFADDAASAADAADAVQVEYEPLPALIDVNKAIAPGATQLHEAAPGNICFRWARGDEKAVQAAFATAKHLIELELTNNRLIGAAIEPRGVIAVPARGHEKLTLVSSTQVPHHIRRMVAEQLGLPESAMRVIAPDVGGGFGYKGKLYPEELIMAFAAQHLQRPVRWTATRTIYSVLLAGVYQTPAICVESIGVFTNTIPTDAYRGAGRPEACYVLERLADQAADKLKIDRAEIRRRNLVPPTAMPYKTPIGPTYDSGNFPKLFGRVLELGAYQTFEARRSSAKKRNVLRGFGMACYVESSGVAPTRFAGALGARAGFYELASIRVEPDGGVRAALGTHNHGQGHATSFAQILASRLGVAIDRITISEGDTDLVPYGTGTFGSRSIAVGGCALDRAADKIIAKGKLIAAHLLEAAAGDIAFADGRFTIAGTDRALSFAQIARAAYVPHNLPLDKIEPGLQDTAVYDPPSFAFSNGAHACEVEIDPDTGVIALVGYWAVDDVGTVINPMIVHGQVQGGIAQGAGQALLERCAYDASGQLLSGSFMDYALPRATDLPHLNAECDETEPCTHNPLGAKGCGEAGAIAAPAAIVSAALDALHPLGIRDIDMPLTPEQIWRRIKNAKSS